MRSMEDYGVSFEFQKSSSMSHHRMPLGKPTPSKWDDAQKWLVNLSGGDKNKAKASPRNSNADDRRLIASMPKDYWNSEEEERDNGHPGSIEVDQCDVETKNVDWTESIWKGDKQVTSPESALRSICLRDTGTEMTPIASQEPSRSATPVRSGNGESKIHKSSTPSTPVRCLNEQLTTQSGPSTVIAAATNDERNGAGRSSGGDPEQLKEELEPSVVNKSNNEGRKMNDPLETRAAAWDEAERAKYMARYKREEVRIQAWENHQKGKAEMEYREVEAKAEMLKSRAQEEYKKKLATTQRMAEEKRANAEAKLREKLAQTGERADYMRRSGQLPSSYPFKLSSSCSSWWCW